MQVVKIHSTRYAIGLWWQILQGLPASPGGQRTQTAPGGQGKALHQARRMAAGFATNGYNCAALRRQQYGLGVQRGRIPRVQSLAAALAHSTESKSKGDVSLLAVYQLSPRGPWWVCAIKKGCIAAEGDFISDSRESAVAHAGQLQHLLALDSPQVFSDASASLADLKARLGRRTPLSGFVGDGRMVSLRSTRRALRIAGTTVLTLLAMFMLYTSGFFSDDSGMLAAREARRQEILAHPERYFPRPWRDTGTAVPWASRCLKSMLDLPRTDAGWDLAMAQCRKDTLEAQWGFGDGASFMQLPQGSALESTQKAVQKVALEPLQNPAPDIALVQKDEVARKLYEMANLFGLHLSLHWSPPASTSVREGSLVVPLKAPWHLGKWAFTDLPAQIVLSPEFYEVLQSIPGIVVEELTHNNGKWELKGICHGR